MDAGTLIKLDEEYSLQTRESSEWDREFRVRHFVVEVGFDLEDLFEIALEGVEGRVNFVVAHQDHLHVDIDRFRFHGACSRNGAAAIERLNFQLPVQEHALQHAPDAGSTSA